MAIRQPMKPGFEKRFENIKWTSSSVLRKFSKDQVDFAVQHFGREPGGPELIKFYKNNPEDGIHIDPTSNLLCVNGLARITNLITGAGGVSMTHANCGLGTGDTATAATSADTQLGSNSTSHSRYIVADATFPTIAGGVITVQATFTSTDGNYAWNEWGLVIATTTTNSDTFAGSGTTPILLNHKAPASLGTKSSGSSWVFTVTLTIS